VVLVAEDAAVPAVPPSPPPQAARAIATPAVSAVAAIRIEASNQVGPGGAGAAIIDGVAGPKRERSLYEISTSFFAVMVILFALAGIVASLTGDEGFGSAGFIICVVFLVLGLGRLYLGLRRG
jgi:hypothetical protein